MRHGKRRDALSGQRALAIALPSSTSAELLHAALPLIRQHGFTREALSRSVLALAEPHAQPLSEPAVSALFGQGDTARRTLINAWLEDGRAQMRAQPSKTTTDALKVRLRHNEPVLPYLPEAFALLASPRSGIPPLDVKLALVHAVSVADEACFATGDISVGPAWYTKRATLAAIYSAAELHQLGSPQTVYAFMDSLVGTAASVHQTVSEVELFAQYVAKSWGGLIKSSGILL
ncbi:hypothetical protein BV25DRAFT_1867783 [Artomyces pyxidatus]|uniref:Uncharacterized protein n=1 Tax=Artomyces pyxidatus TaxID=48021 RepID=A0ACB8TFW9_9AGAM|nr:hypothetical protein BV25DRAFT_1867783 [Artomyces pyxidatus]